MLKVTVNKNTSFEVERLQENFLLNGEEKSLQITDDGNGQLQVIQGNRIHSVEVIAMEASRKAMTLRVNGHDYEVAINDRFDQLLEKLGMKNQMGNQVNDVKAPMPGLVLEVKVETGQQVEKGDALIVLEAMKMENILKAACPGMVQKVNVKQGEAVEKNQVLISFA